MAVVFLGLLSQFPLAFALRHVCVPGTHFVVNDRICKCNHKGWWSESECLTVGRRKCVPGSETWHGCNKCICKENGSLLCNEESCEDQDDVKSQLLGTTWCTPFKAYYVNCSICVCPSSGLLADARCAAVRFCLEPQTSLSSLNENTCIPGVMYLFPCLHCLCSDRGLFHLNKCIETCQTQERFSSRRCIPRTFYRKYCNVCWCPDSGVADDKHCTKSRCGSSPKFVPLSLLRTSQKKCHPHSFVAPRCFYCSCDAEGKVDENKCLERECIKSDEIKNYPQKAICSPGEVVPTCSECFCLSKGYMNKTYCTSTCTYQSKLGVLQRVLLDSLKTQDLFNKQDIIEVAEGDDCEPNTTYLDQGKYCLCPETGSTSFKLCTSLYEFFHKIETDFSNTIQLPKNITCKPNTYVDFDCNTCFCNKHGKIDPKWCTYDDCRAKKIVQNSHKKAQMQNTQTKDIGPNETCIPGTISKADCNFCICPKSGILKERACTKNECSEIEGEVADHSFICEPLAYYLVDCNICLCPSDGNKNVAKCTKKICEKSILRSDDCTAGQFFSNDCNVCVCPPDGNKNDKVCTNHECSDTDKHWKKLYKMSQSILGNHESKSKIKRDIEVCFYGEEFEVGCKMCVCPDVELKAYAVCSEPVCENNRDNTTSDNSENYDSKDGDIVPWSLTRRTVRRDCFTFNLSEACTEREQCTPGSYYIVRCRQCICPYMGSINDFCRPLPKGTYCEQAFPHYNYLPMGRRNYDEIIQTSSSTTEPLNQTKYGCTKPGHVGDECFVCECELQESVVIEEHCYRNDADKCRDALPTFLDRVNKVVIV